MQFDAGTGSRVQNVAPKYRFYRVTLFWPLCQVRLRPNRSSFWGDIGKNVFQSTVYSVIYSVGLKPVGLACCGIAHTPTRVSVQLAFRGCRYMYSSFVVHVRFTSLSRASNRYFATAAWALCRSIHDRLQSSPIYLHRSFLPPYRITDLWLGRFHEFVTLFIWRVFVVVD